MVSTLLNLGLSAVQANAQTRILKQLGYDKSSLESLYGNEDQLNEIYRSHLGSSDIASEIKEYGLDGWLAGNDNVCDDGKDDGKISFGDKVSNFFEGMAKNICGTVKDTLSDPKKLLTAIIGIAATSALAIVSAPAALVAGIAFGSVYLINGVKSVIHSAKKASEAHTDAEAMQAWEGIGSGTLEVGVGAASMYFCGKSLYKNEFIPKTYKQEFLSRAKSFSNVVNNDSK